MNQEVKFGLVPLVDGPPEILQAMEVNGWQLWQDPTVEAGAYFLIHKPPVGFWEAPNEYKCFCMYFVGYPWMEQEVEGWEFGPWENAGQAYWQDGCVVVDGCEGQPPTNTSEMLKILANPMRYL